MIDESEITFGGSYLDRADRLRGDADAMARLLADPASRPVSATLPKRIEPYSSTTLFPFFFRRSLTLNRASDLLRAASAAADSVALSGRFMDS